MGNNVGGKAAGIALLALAGGDAVRAKALWQELRATYPQTVEEAIEDAAEQLAVLQVREQEPQQPDVCGVAITTGLEGLVRCSAPKGHRILQLQTDKSAGGFDHGNADRGLYWRKSDLQTELYRLPLQKIPNVEERQPGTYPTREERDLAKELHDYIWANGSHHRGDIDTQQAADLIARKLTEERSAPKPGSVNPVSAHLRTEAQQETRGIRGHLITAADEIDRLHTGWQKELERHIATLEGQQKPSRAHVARLALTAKRSYLGTTEEQACAAVEELASLIEVEP